MYSTLALALIAQVSAFGLVTIKSGSQYQYSTVKVSSDGHFSLNGESDFDGELSGTTLTVNGKGVLLYEGFPIVGDSSDGGAWALDGNDLTYMGKNAWVICPDNNNNIAYAGQGTPSTCTNAVGVALYAADASNSTSSTTTAAESSAESSAPATTAVSSEAAGTTDVVEETVTETTCTAESCTGVASANAAVANGAILGGVAAVAAALL